MNPVFEFLKVSGWGEFWWVVVGLFGQVMFSMRFIIQWLTSEREKRSVIPDVFWWFSLGGGIILFSYALHRADPVFILGQSMGIFIYSRNLWLIHAAKQNA